MTAVRNDIASLRAQQLFLLCDLAQRNAVQEQIHQSDYLAHLVTKYWGTSTARTHIDNLWKGLWKSGLDNTHLVSDICINSYRWDNSFWLETGQVFDIKDALKSVIKSRQLGNIFVAAESYDWHASLIESENPRLYLSMQFPFKRRFDFNSLFFGFWQRDPTYDFALGNFAKHCFAFYEYWCDNSDVLFTYLFDDDIDCIEIFWNYRPVGQIWLVAGEILGCGNSIFIDGVEYSPALNQKAVQRIILSLDDLFTQIKRLYGVSHVWFNLKAFTRPAARVVGTLLRSQNVQFELVETPRVGESRIRLAEEAPFRQVFRKRNPWAISKRRLARYNGDFARCYLDCWSGFVDPNVQQRETLAMLVA